MHLACTCMVARIVYRVCPQCWFLIHCKSARCHDCCRRVKTLLIGWVANLAARDG